MTFAKAPPVLGIEVPGFEVPDLEVPDLEVTESWGAFQLQCRNPFAMTNSRLFSFFLIVTLVGVTFSGSCGRGRRDSTTGKRLILLTNGDDPFWDAMRRGMDKAAADLDLRSSGLSVYLDKGDFSEEAQISKLQQYATQSDIAAVAISSLGARNRGIADAMKALRAKGVRVITVDADMDREQYRDTRFAYLGTDNIIGGRELGRCAKGLLPSGGKYAAFVGVKEVANAMERVQGFQEGAGKKFARAEYLGDGGDENQAQENVKAALNNHPDLSTLVGIWSYNAHAIVEVVEQRKVRDKVKIVVFDAAPLALTDLEHGKIDAMVVQNPYQMGYVATKLMKALVEDDGETIKELYPDYDPETKSFPPDKAGGDSDILTTELRVVVPSAASPLKPEMFEKTTKFFTYPEFREWLTERKLTQS